MAVLTERVREQLAMMHRVDVLLTKMAQYGRHRRMYAIPADEITEHRESWISQLAGKTAHDLTQESEFGLMPEPHITVWLWAIASPALGITCNPVDGVWDLYPDPYPMPTHLRDDVQWWQQAMTAAPRGTGYSPAECAAALSAELENSQRFLHP